MSRNKPVISLALWNDRGSVASIENDEGSVEITSHRGSRDPKRICLRAAKILRELAAKFEKLAECKDPFKIETQSSLK